VRQKSRGGRPPKIHARNFVSLRLPDDLANAIDGWAQANDAAGRSEAIRRLIEIGLKAKTQE